MCLCTVLDANGQGILYRDQWLLACWWCSCTMHISAQTIWAQSCSYAETMLFAYCLFTIAHCQLPIVYYLLPVAYVSLLMNVCLWVSREARNYVLAWVWRRSGQWTHFLGDSFKQAVFVPLGNIHMWAPGSYLVVFFFTLRNGSVTQSDRLFWMKRKTCQWKELSLVTLPIYETRAIKESSLPAD